MYFISRDNLRELWKKLGGLLYCFIEDELGYTDLIPPLRPGGAYNDPVDWGDDVDIDSLDIDSCRAHEEVWLRTPVVDSFGDCQPTADRKKPKPLLN
jgi:hypothetical protein